MKTNILLILVVMVTSISCGCMVEPPVVPQTTVTALQTGSTRYLLDVFFENAVQGCAVGDSGTILSTTNGGTSWNTIVLDTPIQASAYSVYNGIHFVAGKKYIIQGNGPSTLHRWDGAGSGYYKFVISSGRLFTFIGYSTGQSDGGTALVWNTSSNAWQVAPNWIFRGLPGKPAKLNDSTILCPSRSFMTISSPRIYKINTATTTQGIDTSFAISFALHALSKAPTTSIVVGVGYQNIARSTDNGMTWNYQTTPNGEKLNDVAMISATEGYACGEGGALLKTTDGGASWSTVSSGTTKNLRSIFFPNASVGYAVGEGGTIIKITPGDF